MLNSTKSRKAICNFLKCINEMKMKSACKYLQEAVNYEIQNKIIKSLKNTSTNKEFK